MFNILGAICVGDKTSCGAMVCTGSPFTNIDGRAVARIGDSISCRYGCKIITGSQVDIINGSPLAVHGSLTSKKQCICLSSGNNNKSGVGQSPASAVAVPAAADAGIAYMPETAAVLSEDHWIEFQLTDAENKPLPEQRYVVTDPSGATITGFLNENGYARVSPVKAGLCTVDFPDLGYSTTVDACLP